MGAADAEGGTGRIVWPEGNVRVRGNNLGVDVKV